MWTLIIVTVFVLAHVEAGIIEPQDETIMNYKARRALLTPEQEEFLMELLAADDALIEAATKRGIVDDILQVLAGVGSGTSINIVGGSPNQNQQPAPAPAAPVSQPGAVPAANLAAAAPQADIVAPVASPPAAASNPPSTAAGTPANANTTAIGGNNNHLFMTISSVIMSSNGRNVTAIVDQSLRIATPAPIREFVTSILNVVYCNSVRRVLGRC